MAHRWLSHCLVADGHTTAEIARRLRRSDVAIRGYLTTDPRRG
ncbi:MAG: hypothetical protein ACXIUV_05265 [Alkalilacustris sp.]